MNVGGVALGESTAVLEIIRKDHERILGLFHLLLEGNLRSEKARRETFRDLRRELTRHALLEEDLLYPRLKAKRTYLARVANGHHATADRLINWLECVSMTDKRWYPKLRELRESIAHHIVIEERELPALVLSSFTRSELVILQARFKASRAA